jgi:hypothetical protein
MTFDRESASPRVVLIAAAALLGQAPVLAQANDPAAPPPSERRLTPEQIEAVLAEAAKKREANETHASPDLVQGEARRQVHGEVGFSVGTGGYREVFGTAIYPIGDDGAAAISMDFIDLGRRRDKR